MMSARVLFSLTFVCLANLVGYAQTDSLYMQQWGHDAVTNFNSTNSSQRQIITKETIRNSGYTKVSDLLQLIDAWTYTTLTGENWTSQSNGTSNYENQNWILMLNGQRVQLKGYLTVYINLIGVNIWDIERIEVVNANGLFLGEYNNTGLIHIITQKGSKIGLYAKGSYARGLSLIQPERSIDSNNYFNDENIASATIGYSKNNHHIAGSYTYLYHTNNDTVLEFIYPSTSQMGSRIEYQYTGAKFKHQLQGAFVSYDESNRFKHKQLGYLGLWDLTPNHQLRLSSSYNDNIGRITSNTLVQYRYFKPYKKGNLIWQTGLSYTTADYGFNYIKPYTSITLPVTRKTTIWAETQLALANQTTHPKFTIGLYKRVSFISNYSFVFSYGTVENEAWFFLPWNPGPSTIGNPAYLNQYSSKQATADFYYSIGFGNNVKFSFNSGVKHSNELGSSEYQIIQLPNEPPFIDHTTTVNTWQTNWINRLNFHYDIIKNLAFDINYMNTGIVDTWNDHIRNTPKHKFTLIVQYNMPKQFTFWVRNYWQSETQWWNETQLEREPMYDGSDLYDTLPAVYTWDIGLGKKLFKEYLKLNLSARNLFNANEQYALNGAQFDLRFMASITANIDGIFAKSSPKP